jgi:hypothetical protein
VDTRPTLLKELLARQHLRYETFRAAYERTAAELAPELRHTAPSRAQYHRWLAGQLKGGTPHPDACRVLEGMFAPWTADALFSPPDGAGQPLDGAGEPAGLLAAVPPSFPAGLLAGAWATGYRFSQPPKLHVDIARITAVTDRRLVAANAPPEPRTQGHPVGYRNAITAELAGRHLIGQWRNSSDARYFGGLHLAVLPGEVVLDGHYTGLASDVGVVAGRWKWVRLDPATLAGVELGAVRLRAPEELYARIEAHSQYDPPLPLDAAAEEP